MKQFIPHTLSGNTFLLSSDRCIFWQEQKTLILSDLHLGKTGHFRKAGIAVPQAIFKEDMQRLVTLLQLYKPQQVVVIGDMFHSVDNKEHDFFIRWRKDFAQLAIMLVKGNHDILKESWYTGAGIQVCCGEDGSVSRALKIGNFVFTHDINDPLLDPIDPSLYFFSGHIHPGISIHGLANQSLHFPCFYFGEQYAVLPAFSRFTGTYTIKPKRGEAVYALLPNNHLKGELGGIMKV
ncbi:MAG: metallophosphoesterase [Ferruginibacter sp.]|nr:metallophosphoesterase [Ferruginibacter sp.]